MDPDQRAVIALSLDGSHLVSGPPGSGKTNLLLLRAQYLDLAGHPNILVLVYTRGLREFVVSGAGQYGFSDESRILTSRKWELSLLQEYGESTVLPDGMPYEDGRTLLLERTLELLERRQIHKRYEAILLDETQDYLPGEIDMCSRLAKTIFAVTDSRQKIYGTADCLDAIQSLVDEEHTLRYHYRMGRIICQLADGLADGNTPMLLTTCNYDETARPSSVVHDRYPSLEAQVDAITEKLLVQLKAYPDELLGVLCIRNEDVTSVWEMLQERELGVSIGFQAAGQHTVFEDHRIVVSSVHSAKGLEVRALHLAGADRLRGFPLERNLAYTAVTRAKTSLSIYYSGNLPAYFRQALADLEVPPNLPKIEDLFSETST